jgi:hypothetical protein
MKRLPVLTLMEDITLLDTVNRTKCNGDMNKIPMPRRRDQG